MIFSQNVENVRFEQQEDRIIIYYNLIPGKDKGSYTVNAYYTPDYGNNYICLKSVTGDAGSDISAGNQKKIVWDVLDDVDELKGTIKIKIIADFNKKQTISDYDLFIGFKTGINFPSSEEQ